MQVCTCTTRAPSGEPNRKRSTLTLLSTSGIPYIQQSQTSVHGSANAWPEFGNIPRIPDMPANQTNHQARVVTMVWSSGLEMDISIITSADSGRRVLVPVSYVSSFPR